MRRTSIICLDSEMCCRRVSSFDLLSSCKITQYDCRPLRFCKHICCYFHHSFREFGNLNCKFSFEPPLVWKFKVEPTSVDWLPSDQSECKPRFPSHYPQFDIHSSVKHNRLEPRRKVSRSHVNRGRCYHITRRTELLTSKLGEIDHLHSIYG